MDGKPLKDFPYPHHAIVGGDDRSLAIACASILAKVARDRLMDSLESNFRLRMAKKQKDMGQNFTENNCNQLTLSPAQSLIFKENIG